MGTLPINLPQDRRETGKAAARKCSADSIQRWRRPHRRRRVLACSPLRVLQFCSPTESSVAISSSRQRGRSSSDTSLKDR